MKKTFLITFAIAFGATSAILLFSIVMVATGMVKKSVFGGYSFSFESIASSKEVKDYDKTKGIVMGLVVTDVNIADTDDARMKKIICEIENPNSEDLVDELVGFDVVLYKDSKVLRVLNTVESVTVKAKEKKRVLMDFICKDALVYDKVELVPRG